VFENIKEDNKVIHEKKQAMLRATVGSVAISNN